MRRFFSYALFLVIAVIAGWVWVNYQQRLALQQQQAPPKPRSLDRGLNSQAEGFVYATSAGDRTVAEVRAKNYREVKDPPHMELQEMELRLFHEDGQAFDLVKSASGNFYPAEGRLSSEGEVVVEMAVGGGDRQLQIRAQGATLDIKTGKMSSEGAVDFRFAQSAGLGTGQAVGAEYDPQVKELRLKHAASVVWTPAGPGAIPTRIWTEELVYREVDSRVLLAPWGKLEKGEFLLEAKAPSEVVLEQGVIRHVAAGQATGRERTPQRIVDYAAKLLQMDFNPQGLLEKVIAEEDARLESVGDNGRTLAEARRMDLFFRVTEKESLLEKALANGRARMESVPPQRGKASAPERRILSSEALELRMKPDGRELDVVEAHAPGTLEFVPQAAGQRRRRLEGERMKFQYGQRNQLASFRAVSVKTRSDGPRPGAPPVLTSSADLAARFDEQTGELLELEQWNDFQYEEGTRRARAKRAVQDSRQQRIVLREAARVWDPTGVIEAQEIRLEQRSGDVDALGQVRSTRETEAKPGAKPAPATQATADRMQARDQNTRIQYDGNAVMWQGENRLRAPHIEIDRRKRQLRASGGIVHQMIEDKPGGALTRVEAREMFYDEGERVIEYRDAVKLARPGLDVNSRQLRAYLAEENTEVQSEQPAGNIEKAFAYGAVRIVETSEERTRKGSGEAAEYYTSEERLILSGGKPEMVDIVRGVEQRRTTGKELSWFARQNRILVDGAEQTPTRSVVKRKR